MKEVDSEHQTKMSEKCDYGIAVIAQMFNY